MVTRIEGHRRRKTGRGHPLRHLRSSSCRPRHRPSGEAAAPRLLGDKIPISNSVAGLGALTARPTRTPSRWTREAQCRPPRSPPRPVPPTTGPRLDRPTCFSPSLVVRLRPPSTIGHHKQEQKTDGHLGVAECSCVLAEFRPLGASMGTEHRNRKRDALVTRPHNICTSTLLSDVQHFGCVKMAANITCRVRPLETMAPMAFT